jgi:hypothetical protein
LGVEENPMNIDIDKVDRAVLALLYLGLHDHYRAWKSHDWEALNRLHEKGLIENPVSKAKGVDFTEEGLNKAKQLLEELFGQTPKE